MAAFHAAYRQQLDSAGLNNRAEASQKHTRRREKIMGRFKSAKQSQIFPASHDQISALFRPKRHRLSAISYRHARADAFSLWDGMANELAAWFGPAGFHAACRQQLDSAQRPSLRANNMTIHVKLINGKGVA